MSNCRMTGKKGEAGGIGGLLHRVAQELITKSHDITSTQNGTKKSSVPRMLIQARPVHSLMRSIQSATRSHRFIGGRMPAGKITKRM